VWGRGVNRLGCWGVGVVWVGGWGGALGYYMCVCVCAFYYIFACLLVHISPSLFSHTYIYIEREREIIQYTFSQGNFSSCTSTDLTPLHLTDDDICPKFV
jgi:hypothetical protein